MRTEEGGLGSYKVRVPTWVRGFSGDYGGTGQRRATVERRVT